MDHFLCTISVASDVARYDPSTGVNQTLPVANPTVFETDGPITKDAENQLKILLNDGLNVLPSGLGQPTGFADGEYVTFLAADDANIAIAIV